MLKPLISDQLVIVPERGSLRYLTGFRLNTEQASRLVKGRPVVWKLGTHHNPRKFEHHSVVVNLDMNTGNGGFLNQNLINFNINEAFSLHPDLLNGTVIIGPTKYLTGIKLGV